MMSPPGRCLKSFVLRCLQLQWLPPECGRHLALRTSVQFKADLVEHESQRLVRLAGRLQHEHVAELLKLCEQASASLRLDLTDLLSVDAPGLEALVSMQQRGAVLEGASPYLVLQLECAQPKHDHK
jgi:ABC-type transporter Mla MlaB component